jgi:hypothetical protein
MQPLAFNPHICNRRTTKSIHPANKSSAAPYLDKKTPSESPRQQSSRREEEGGDYERTGGSGVVLRRRKEKEARGRTRGEECVSDDSGSGSWEQTGERRQPGGRGEPPPPAGAAPRGRRSRTLGLDAGSVE